MLSLNKKLLFSVLALALATLACGLPTPGTNSTEPNSVATQLAATIAALQQEQAATVAAPPNAIVPTNTQAAVATVATPVLTATPSIPMLSVSINTNCRSGPGLKYPITGSIVTNGSFEVVAQAPSSTPYLIIRNPDGGADCWAWLEHATVAGLVSNLPILPIPPIPLGSISGFVWVEDCDDVNPANTGCINNTNSGFPEGDGAFNNELLLQGINAELFTGKCPSTTSMATSLTNANGSYKFNNLEAGTYCVVVDTFNHGNDTILIQQFGGIFTFPNRANALQTHQIDLLPGQHISGFNFGWDDFEQ
ncbi:MAG: hypothetical protein HN392_04145 [Anaerolineae bacterium]|jgi:hypothetical protein|nr:hypothetical protein [Anaerolineae bacterium]MBT7783351.1 hypothetical protein [Anaerolineae bacterium]